MNTKMPTIKKHHFLALVCCTLISGCSTTSSVEEFNKYTSDRKALRVVAQVCVPNKTTYFDTLTVDVTDLPANISYLELRKLFQDAVEYKAGEGFTNPYQSNSPNREYQTTRLWRKPFNTSDYSQYFIAGGSAANVKGIMSAGSGAEYLADSTEKNQPVFLANLSERPEDILAVSVTPPKDDKGELRELWYKLPKEISKDKYTEWINPASEEGKKEQSGKSPIFWLLTHGKELPIYKVNQDAPKVRYILMTMDEYAKYSEYGRRAINSARLQSMKSNPSDREHQHYVPAKRENIPPC